MGETNSQIAMLTRVLREKKNKMEEFQHKLLDQSTSEVLCNIVFVLVQELNYNAVAYANITQVVRTLF